MTPTAFFILLGTLIAGVLAIVIGRRGWRVNDHPVCRQCRFDLQGVYPGGVTCPECGAGLKRESAIRHGVRRRFHSLTALGGLLILLPLAPLAIVLYSTLTGTDINKYKPLPLLLWEAPRANGPSSAAIAEELYDRLQNKVLSKSSTSDVVEIALAIQADEQRPWSESWGDVVDRANLNGDASDEQMRRFRNHGLVLKAETRPRVRAGDPVPLLISTQEARVAANDQLMAMLSAGEIKIDGKPMKKVRVPRFDMMSTLFGGFNSGFSEGEAPTTTTFSVSGSKSRMGMMGMSTASWPFRIPQDTPPGQHQIEIEIILSCEAWGVSRTITWGDTNDKKDPKKRVVTLTVPVEVVAAETDPITPIAATAELAERMSAALRPQSLMVHVIPADLGGRAEMTHVLQAQFDLKDIPVGIAFEVVAKGDGKEWNLGTITSGRGGEPNQAVNFGGTEDFRMLSTQMSDSPPKRVDLYFKPNLDLARRTLDLSRVYDGEIVVQNLQVQGTEASGAIMSWSGDISVATQGASPRVAPSVTVAATYPDPGPPGAEPFRAAAPYGDYVYALGRAGTLRTFRAPAADGKFPVAPTATTQSAGNGNDVNVINGHLITTAEHGLIVFSIAQPEMPRELARTPGSGSAGRTIVVHGNLAFVVGAGLIAGYDLSRPADPKVLFDQKSDRNWWSACVIGKHLCVGEAGDQLGESSETKRVGVAVMELGDRGVTEVAFAETPTPYHLFTLDDRYVLAVLDDGKAMRIDLATPSWPLVATIKHGTGGRSAALFKDDAAAMLVCAGAAMTFQGNQPASTSTLDFQLHVPDGFPYHGHSHGKWAALPGQDKVVVLRIDSK